MTLRLFSRRPQLVAHDGIELERLETKRESLAQATRQWLALLRELEGEGKTNDPQYEAYFQAYMQSRHQEKRIELQLFNLRQGLSG